MKNLLLILIVLSACTSAEQQFKNKYDLLLKEQNKVTERNDKLFDGYCFGMTEDQFKIKSDSLVGVNLLFINKDSLYYIPKKTTINGICNLTLFPNFKLRKLSGLKIKTNYDGTEASFRLLLYDLRDLVQNKFVTLFSEKINTVNSEDFQECFWINSNKEIHLFKWGNSANIEFTDLRPQN
ncbi:MAG: hypothetical protein A3F72_02850 [Bacteroidetes bacterium RIFCSPLOWO2_12_FULL_35_15]|nr:MAG: hypothetical protein A3F72_02850 [Bacteroidetes bacterium RIFCSPLOWO2_12_FULL_35_15]